MNFGLANVRAITMAAVGLVIVPGIYVLASKAATHLVMEVRSTSAPAHANRVALESETMHFPVECVAAHEVAALGTRKARALCKATTNAGILAAAQAAVGTKPAGNDVLVD